LTGCDSLLLNSTSSEPSNPPWLRITTSHIVVFHGRFKGRHGSAAGRPPLWSQETPWSAVAKRLHLTGIWCASGAGWQPAGCRDLRCARMVPQSASAIACRSWLVGGSGAPADCQSAIQPTASRRYVRGERSARQVRAQQMRVRCRAEQGGDTALGGAERPGIFLWPDVAGSASENLKRTE